MEKFIYHLTWDELSDILGRAEVAFRDDYKTYGEMKDLMRANLCKEMYEDTLATDENFYTIKGE